MPFSPKALLIPRDIIAIFWLAFCALCGLHVIQPLLPQIAAEFSISPAGAGLLTSATLLPLGIMAIFYGFLFKNRQPKKILLPAFIIYALSMLPAPLGGDFNSLLLGRIFQGFTLPAILVCLMTYIGCRYKDMVMQKYMSYYAFFVIVGSYTGRILGSAIADYLDNWRYAFFAPLFLSITAFISCLFLKDIAAQTVDANFGSLRSLLRQKYLILLLFITPLLCFASGAIMNVLPFRLREIAPGISPLSVSQIYSGVLICSLTGFIGPKILKAIPSQMLAIIIAIGLYIGFFPFMLSHNPIIFVAGFIGYNFGMAFIYVSMPGILNRFADKQKYLLNGIYISLYYFSNSAGSYFPLRIYQDAGFPYFIFCLMAMAGIALAIALYCRKAVI